MEKHRWMVEVIDDLTFYAVANNLRDVAAQLKKVRREMDDFLHEEEIDNVIQVEFVRKESSCA